jgi:uncharacterized protein (TIGR02147 family)
MVLLSMSIKSVFEYDNYRQYLKDFYTAAKAENSKFSFRFLARQAGLSSASFLKHVMDGQRNLSNESAEKVIRALKFNREEALHFKKLVQLNQATTTEERQKCAKEILRSQIYRQTHPLKESEYLYFSKWYFIAIRELLTLSGAKADVQWLSEHIFPSLRRVEVEQALSALTDLGLIEKDSEGASNTKKIHLATPDEVTSSSLAQVHCELMDLAKESIDRFDREKRDISSVTVRVNAESIQKVKEKIQNFRKEMVELCLSESDPNSIYQLNIQLFPLAAVGGDKT